MDELTCFICGIKTVFYLRNVAKKKSKHSETTILEFLRILCGDDEFTFCEQNIICMVCMEKINDYDAACLIKERIEREFRETLNRSEVLHTNSKYLKIADAKIECIDSIEGAADKSYECEIVSDSEQMQANSDDRRTPHITNSEKCNSNDGESHQFNTHLTTFQTKKRIIMCPTDSKRHNHKKSCARKTNEALKCHLCGIIAGNEESLSEHEALHKNKPKLQCITCDQILKNKATLVRHTRIHVGKKNFQCEKCGKEFMHYSSLQMHIKAHEDIREKQCPHCPNQFPSTSHLNRHLRIHTGDKPFSCPKCGQRFAQRYNMTAHLRLHDSAEKTKAVLKHVCSICDKAFPRPSKLVEHYSRAHETLMPYTSNENEIAAKIENASDEEV